MKFRVYPANGVAFAGLDMGKPKDVEAEYFRVEDGVLIFRKSVPQSFPIPVHTFAAGTWMEVGEAMSPAERIVADKCTSSHRELDHA